MTSSQKEGADVCLGTPLPTFTCPSRRACKVYPTTSGNMCISQAQNSTGTVLSVARSDYACNHGSSSNVTQTTLRDPTSMEEGVTKTKNKTWEEQKETGVIYRRSEVSDSMIRDGLSNTYLIGEKYCNPTYYELENAPTDNEGMYYGADDDNQRRTHSSSLPMQDRTGYSGNYNFGSPHAGTFGMVLADGSVQRISYSIDAETHSNLGNRADGNPVTIP